MNKLSARERFLLMVLAVILIVVGGIKFLVLPLNDRYWQLREQLEQKQAQVDEYSAVVADAQENLGGIIQEAKQRQQEYQGRLYAVMTNGELDQLLTQLVLEHGLNPLAAAYDDAGLRDVLPFGVTAAAAEEARQTAVEGKEIVYPQVVTNTATLTVSGTLNKMIALIDAIADNPGLVVTAVVGEERGVQAAAIGDAPAYQFEISFAVYMTE
ncbi:MAG: hypothetical protein RR387_02700 [Clostridiales bacterium]